MEKFGNVYVFTFNITNSVMALPINFYVVLIILLSSQLRKQPKYLMKINASICSLFTLLTDGFESAYYIEPSQELCHASVFTLGWSNIFLLFNTLLALIDCWLEMTKPKFYAENVTPMFLVVLSSILNAMLIFLLDWVYIFGVEPVRCALPHHLVSTFILLHWFCYFHLRQDEIGCFSR